MRLISDGCRSARCSRHRPNKTLPGLVNAALLTLLLFLLPGGAGAGADTLKRLAASEKWPGVTQLIAFDGGIWFVNSNPYENFNAADIYRYEPASGKLTYERGLASQDAGRPVVHDGRMFWPYEDPRSNSGLGEYEVTNGKDWRWHSFTEGEALHVHVMGACGGRLLAGVGGWEGALQASTDNGASWQEVLRLGGTQSDVTRIVDIAAIGGRCLIAGSGYEQPGPRVFELNGNKAVPVAGWPRAQRISALTRFKDHIYAIVESHDGRTVWRHDGKQAERLRIDANGLPRDLASDGRTLFLALSDAEGGEIMSSGDGDSWSLVQRMDKEHPVDLLSVSGDLYVGTYDDERGGALWGPAQPSVEVPGPKPGILPRLEVTELNAPPTDAAFRTLQIALQPKPDFTSFRAGIMSVLLPLALTHDKDVGMRLSSITGQQFPKGEIMTFTRHRYQTGELAVWLILHTVGLNGHGEVNRQWLAQTWSAEPRPSEKYFETQLAAIWTAGRVKQDDRETISILVERLMRANEPGWLKGDVVAVLTMLTGRRFGHDHAAWAEWWNGARDDWKGRDG